MERNVKFDIALSFAGENRKYVDEVATSLKNKGISVFYDLFEEEKLWGKNLYDYLSDIYQNQARYTIMFISESYKQKLWTNHERQAMQSRAFQESQEYVLPARFDDTEIAGVLPTVGYIDLRTKSPEEFVQIIERKLIYSGGTIPSEILRKALSTITPIPKIQPHELIITVLNKKDQSVIPDVQVILSAENGTYLSTLTNEQGIGKIEIQTKRFYSVLIAHPNFPSILIERLDLESDLKVELSEIDNVGSIIIQSTGYIPGLTGRLNPIYDSSHRMYLYADNIAIDGGINQPVHFSLNNTLVLEDCNGVIMNLIFRFVNGRTTALIDYVKPVLVEE